MPKFDFTTGKVLYEENDNNVIPTNPSQSSKNTPVFNFSTGDVSYTPNKQTTPEIGQNLNQNVQKAVESISFEEPKKTFLQKLDSVIPQIPEKEGKIGSFIGALGTGVVNMSAKGVASLLQVPKRNFDSYLSGSKQNVNLQSRGIKSVPKYAEAMSELADKISAFGDSVVESNESRSSINQTVDKVAQTIGGVVPFVAATYIGKNPGLALSIGMNSSMNAEDVYQQNIKKGVSEKEALKKYESTFTATTITNGVFSALGPLGKIAGNKYSVLKNPVAEYVKDVLSEVIEENIEQVIQNINTGEQWNKGLKETTLYTLPVALLLGGAGAISNDTAQPAPEIDKKDKKSIKEFVSNLLDRGATKKDIVAITSGISNQSENIINQKIEQSISGDQEIEQKIIENDKKEIDEIIKQTAEDVKTTDQEKVSEIDSVIEQGITEAKNEYDIARDLQNKFGMKIEDAAKAIESNQKKSKKPESKKLYRLTPENVDDNFRPAKIAGTKDQEGIHFFSDKSSVENETFKARFGTKVNEVSVDGEIADINRGSQDTNLKDIISLPMNELVPILKERGYAGLNIGNEVIIFDKKDIKTDLTELSESLDNKDYGNNQQQSRPIPDRGEKTESERGGTDRSVLSSYQGNVSQGEQLPTDGRTESEISDTVANIKRETSEKRSVVTKYNSQTREVMSRLGFTEQFLQKFDKAHAKGGFTNISFTSYINGDSIYGAYDSLSDTFYINPEDINSPMYESGAIIDHEIYGHSWFSRLNSEQKTLVVASMSENKDILRNAWSRTGNLFRGYWKDTIRQIRKKVLESAGNITSDVMFEAGLFEQDISFEEYIEKSTTMQSQLDTVNDILLKRGLQKVELNAYDMIAVNENVAMIAEHAKELSFDFSGTNVIHNYITSVNDQLLEFGQAGTNEVMQRKKDSEKKLVVAHNISAEKLRKATQLGGLANPSLAIYDPAKFTFEKFGEITLLGSKELPFSGKAQTFSADAYTARFPNIVSTVDYTKLREYEKENNVKFDDLDMGEFYRDASRSESVIQYYLNTQNITIPENFSIREMRDLITDKDDFNTFIDQLGKDIGIEEKIFIGYTNTGKRKYQEATLENISKYMNRQKDEAFFYGAGSARSKVLQKFTNTSQVKNAENLLVSAEEFEKVRKESEDKFTELKDQLDSLFPDKWMDSASNISSYIAGDTKVFEDIYGELPESFILQVKQFKEYIKGLPTEYFEVKFKRPVTLNEFAYAVVPEETTAEIRKILTDSGLEIVDYAENNRGDVVMDTASSRDIMFRNKPEFQGFTDLSTTILNKLIGRTTVSKQFISDLTNTGDLKQVEREIVRNILVNFPDTVNVQEFADTVKAELLPLTVKTSDVINASAIDQYSPDYMVNEGSFSTKYDSVALPDDLRGDVANYTEVIYESPIKTSAGNVHFNYITDSYYGNTRLEDMADNKTRRVIEVQSDLYQKDRLEDEIIRMSAIRTLESSKKYLTEDEIFEFNKLKDVPDLKGKDLERYKYLWEKSKIGAEKDFSKLQQYNNPTAHFRMVREEVKAAAENGKKKLQFPTGETAMKIEGLGSQEMWVNVRQTQRGNIPTMNRVTPQELKVGLEISQADPININTSGNWIITDVLGDGKFKAVPKEIYNRSYEIREESGGYVIYINKRPSADVFPTFESAQSSAEMQGLTELRNEEYLNRYSETFDISGKVDTNNPIYRFYEKDLGRYLKSKYGAKQVTDDKGVSWYEVDIKPEMADQPVLAFRRKMSDEDIEIISMLEAYNDQLRFELEDHPGRRLVPFANTREGEIIEIYPEKYKEGTQKYIRATERKENLNRAIRMIEETRPWMMQGEYEYVENNVTLANDLVADFRRKKQALKENQDKIKEIKKKYVDQKFPNIDTGNRLADAQRTLEYTEARLTEKDNPKRKIEVMDDVQYLPDDITEEWNAYDNAIELGIPEETIIQLEEDIKEDVKEFKDKIVEQKMNEIIERAKPLDRTTAKEAFDKGMENAKQQAEKEQKNIRDSNVARETPISKMSFWQKIKQSLNPLSFVDGKTRKIFEQWYAKNLQAKNLANRDAKTFDIKPEESWDIIMDYQAGKENQYTDKLKQVFDSLYREARERGIEIGFIERYIPQVYKETPDEIDQKIKEYLKNKGLTDEQIYGYVEEGKKLPEEIVKFLKVNPYFSRVRTFPDYKTAMEYGLTPKYTNINQLVAYYREELEKSVANRELVQQLREEGKVMPVEFAPRTWVPINLPFSEKGYYSDPKTAKVLNGLFNNPSDIGAFGEFFHIVRKVSGRLQEINLSAGLPYTNINFFSIGAGLIKELTAGNYKALPLFIRANFTEKSLEWINSKRDIIDKMSRQGIDVVGSIDDYTKLRQMTIGSKSWKEKIFGEKIAKEIDFDKAFNEKTFGSFMVQLRIQLFEDVYFSALKKGMNDEFAQQLAAQVVRNNFGITKFQGRSGATEDFLGATFFAPKFRESVLNTLFNTGKAGYDFVESVGGIRKPLDPSLNRNLRLLIGMILMFGLYDLLNKELNGHHMWDNPKNRTFALQIPTQNGTLIYLEFMPSFLAFARNLATGAINLMSGDFSGATQKFGTVFSMPMKITSELISNSDYFGTPIYKDTDTTAQKIGKMTKYVGLQATHPYIKETISQIGEEKPLYQSIITGVELPLKFSTMEKVSQQEFYEAMDKMAKENARKLERIKPIYDEIQSLKNSGDLQGATDLYETLTEDEQAVYQKIKTSEKSATTRSSQAKLYTDFKKIIEYRDSGETEKATELYNQLSSTEKELYQKVKDNAVFKSSYAQSTTAEIKKSEYERNILELAVAYAKAYGTDPGNAFKAMFTNEKLGQVKGNLVELQRFKGIPFNKPGGSEEYIKKQLMEMGIPWSERSNYNLEHIVPVKAGGSTHPSNLKVVDRETHNQWTKYDIEMAKAVQEGRVTRKEIEKIAKDLKSGTISEVEFYFLIKK